MNTENFDIVIMGTGPAGLQAALHATRRNVSVLVMGKLKKSSTYNAHIDNFCCVDGNNGIDMLKQARLKTEESGAIFIDEDAVDLNLEQQSYIITSENGKHIKARAVILAMGISRNRLGLQNEKKLIGSGVSYCVDCDGGFFRGESVAVIGCESAAVTGALTLLFYAKDVHLVCEQLEVSDFLNEKIKDSEIIVHEGTAPARIIGDNAVKGLILDNGTTLDVNGIFIELGAKGALELASRIGVIMAQPDLKYIETNKKQETNLAGIYAAGDICGPPWQVAKAVGEGCIAGLEAANYVRNINKSKN